MHVHWLLLLLHTSMQGEAATVAAFERDPYGCAGPLLAKRVRRDPFAVGPPHPSRCPALAGLLAHCAPKLFSGAVPWPEETQQQQQPRARLKSGRRSSRAGIYT